MTNKENMDKQPQEMSDAEDRELIDLLTPSTAAEIETAIRVVQRINYGAAYGTTRNCARPLSRRWAHCVPPTPSMTPEEGAEKMTTSVDAVVVPRELWEIIVLNVSGQLF